MAASRREGGLEQEIALLGPGDFRGRDVAHDRGAARRDRRGTTTSVQCFPPGQAGVRGRAAAAPGHRRAGGGDPGAAARRAHGRPREPGSRGAHEARRRPRRWTCSAASAISSAFTTKGASPCGALTRSRARCSPWRADPVPPPATPLAPGAWGGAHAQIQVSPDETRVELECAQGLIRGPLTGGQARPRGLPGSLIPAGQGPRAETDAGAGEPARFRGTLVGKTLTLTITVVGPAEDVGTFHLTLGKTGRLASCP